jgi:peroxiredoxin
MLVYLGLIHFSMKRLLQFTLPIVLTALLLLCFPQSSGAKFESNSSRTPKVGLRVGNQAPDFELPMPDGTMLSLSSLRGKIVLIDFWASWCKGCRNKKGTIAVYNRYKDEKFVNANGFTVLSVSLDREKEPWLKAIKDDGLIWENHVCDFKVFKTNTSKLYNLGGVPRKWLVDENGIIIARDLSSSELKVILDKRLKE